MIKTVCQHSRFVTKEDMRILRELAGDYASVKNYVYSRYAGIRSFQKLYPGYTIQNEMTRSGLRGQLRLPSVYFYPAVFDAIGDIKAGWKVLRKKVLRNAIANPGFSQEEKHYICIVLNSDSLFRQLLMGEETVLTGGFQADDLDKEKLHRYICRQIRRHKSAHRAAQNNYFKVTPKGYDYGDGGIRLATKIPRRRLLIPLTDTNEYHRQLEVCLGESSVTIRVPVEVKLKEHPAYDREVALSLGFHTMFTTSEGAVYGEAYGERRLEQIDLIKGRIAARQRAASLCRRYRAEGNDAKADHILKNNLGSKKYDRQKAKADWEIKAYINKEILRMIRTERPKVIFYPKLLYGRNPGQYQAFHRELSFWHRGYIQRQLRFRCGENQISLVQVYSAGIGRECSSCGGTGARQKEYFYCPSCGYREKAGINAARNVLRRGRESWSGRAD